MTHFDVVEPLDHEAESIGNAFTMPVPIPYRTPLLRRALQAVRSAVAGYPANFVSRAEWGARPPKSRSTNISPSEGGVAWHYEGPTMGPFGHHQCAGKVRQIQAFHMGSARGWVDIAYSALVCPHGYIYEGRGLGVRTAANGTNVGNQTHYAICGLLGLNDPLTPDMIEAYKNCTRWMREAGRAGLSVKPHRFFKATGCPGDLVLTEAAKWDGKSLTPAPVPPPAPSPGLSHPHPQPTLGRTSPTNTLAAIKDLQGHLNYAYRLHPEITTLAIDGTWGERTEIRFRDWQSRTGLRVDGICGSISWSRLNEVTGGKRHDQQRVEW